MKKLLYSCITLLFVASHQSIAMETVQVVEQKENVAIDEQVDQVGRTPLFYAQNVLSLAPILKGKPDVGHLDNDGLTAAHFMIQNNADIECIRQLLLYYQQFEIRGKPLRLHDIKCQGDWMNLGHFAAVHNRPDVLRLLFELDKDFDINAFDLRGRLTPLHYGASGGYSDIVGILLDHGADISFPSTALRTPLHLAAEISFSIFKLLVFNGANYQAEDRYSETPKRIILDRFRDAAKEFFKHLANNNLESLFNNAKQTPLFIAVEKNPNAIGWLITNGARHHLRNKAGDTPVHHALKGNYSVSFKELLEAGVSPDSKDIQGDTPLHIAARNHDGYSLRTLCTYNANESLYNAEGNLALHCAYDSPEALSILLTAGTPVDAQNRNGETVLHLAIQARNHQSIQAILKHKTANTLFIENRKGENPIQYLLKEFERSCQQSAIDIISPADNLAQILRLFLETDSSILSITDTSKNTLLHMATKTRNIEGMQEILKYKTSSLLAAQNDEGATALHYAVQDPMLIGLLVNHGAPLEIADNNGETALFYAAQVSVRSVKNLLALGANLNALSRNKRTPLFNAARCNPEVVEYLLELGLNPSARDANWRRTPLMVAARYNPSCLIPLLGAGAPIEDMDIAERRALHFAAAYNQPAALQILLDHGAEVDPEDTYVATPYYYARNEDCKIKLQNAGCETRRVGRIKWKNASDVKNERERKIIIEEFGEDVTIEHSDKLVHMLALYRPERLEKELPRLDLKARNFFGATPLHLAAKSQPDSLRILLRDPKMIELLDARDYRNATPLHYAASSSLPCLKILLDHKLDIDATDRYGSTPLHYAAYFSYHYGTDLVSLLISSGANIHKRNDFGDTALDIAFCSNSDVASLLINAGASIKPISVPNSTFVNKTAHPSNHEDWRPSEEWKKKNSRILAQLARFNCDPELKDVLRSDIETSSIKGWTILHALVFRSHKLLKEYKVPGIDFNIINSLGETPLHVACLGKTDTCFNSVKVLINSLKAQIGCKDNLGQTALHKAAMHGNLKIVKFLIKKNKTLLDQQDNKGQTPLHLAALTNHQEVIAFLIKKGADQNIATQDGNPPIFFASLSGCPLSLFPKAEIRRTNKRGENLLMWALLHRKEEAIRDIVEQGILDLRTADNAGNTILHHAVYALSNLIEFLIDHGAPANVQNKEGNTPLHLAARRGDVPVLEALCKGGALCTIFNNKNSAPFMEADAYDNPDATRFLLQRTQFLPAMPKNDELLTLKYGTADEIQSLLQRGGVSLEKYFIPGMTPVHIVTKYNSPDALKVVLTYQSDLEIKNGEGYTALELALRYNVDAVPLLVQAGASVPLLENEITYIPTNQYRVFCPASKEEVERSRRLAMLEPINFQESLSSERYLPSRKNDTPPSS